MLMMKLTWTERITQHPLLMEMREETRYNFFGSFFFADFVLRLKLEKDGEDENSQAYSKATLEEDCDSTTKIWKETSEFSKKCEANHDLEKVSQGEHENHN